MYKKVIRFILRVVLPNGFRNQISIWIKSNKKALSSEKQEFASINSLNFKNNQGMPDNNDFVLVEGFLASYGPNYLLRTGIIAKAIEKELGLAPMVLLENSIENEEEKIRLYKSFGIGHFKTIQNFQPPFSDRIQNVILALKLYRTVVKPEDLIALEYNGIVFGDLVYDTILKNVPNMYTISKISVREFLYIYEALHFISLYSNVLNNNRIRFYVTTHSQYLSFGILLRLCLSKNIQVLETTDIQFWHHQKKADSGSISYPKYHDYLREQIELKLEHDDLSAVEMGSILRDRFAGNFEQSDARMAYKNKRVYRSSELREALNIENDYPFVFIFAHIFSDAPQGCGNGMLFRDYYTWLKETILAACEIKDVNWVIKPHPANTIYNEAGLVDEIVAKSSGSNVFICPTDLSPASVIDVASAIITAQGTVGIEYTCMGIPVLLAGRPFYSGFGFTIEPDSIEEYKAAMSKITTYTKLTESQQTAAKKVFAAFMQMQQTDTSLIDTDVLFAVWGGNGVPGSPDKAFNLINEKLPGLDLTEYSLYKQTLELLKKQNDI